MREMREASGEAARAWGEVGGAGRRESLSSPSPAHLAPRSRGFATHVSQLAHKTQARACSQATADKCFLGKNNLKFQSVTEFLLCVAGMQECFMKWLHYAN